MKPEDIIKKVGADKFREALNSENGDALKTLLESEGIVLTPDQLDYIAGGIGFYDPAATCDGRPDDDSGEVTCIID